MIEGMLNAQGAALMRQARDHIVAHPEEFGMAAWSNRCGTLCCIGGRMAHILGVCTDAHDGDHELTEYCGFAPHDTTDEDSPFFSLFFEWEDSRSVREAVKKINAFLEEHGHPKDVEAACVS